MANEIWQGSNINGSAGIDWNIGSNWNTGIVPQLGDTVEIPAGTPLADLFGATATIASLTVDDGGSADLTGDMTVTGNLVDNGGVGVDYQLEVEGGGSTLTVGGTLTVTNAGDPFAVGNRFQLAATTVVVGALSNTGAIDIAGNAGGPGQSAVLAQLDVASTAGIGGVAGVLTGDISLGIGIAGGGGQGDALLDFEGGGLINTIENGTLALSGPLAFVASGNAISSSSALAGPLTVANGASLSLADGASLSPQSLTASGGVGIDSAIESPGGSSLFIGGMLTAANGGAPFALGNEDQTSPTTVTAASVANTGGIEIGGNPGGTNQAPVLAQLDVASTAGFGGMPGVLTGNVTLGMGIGGGGGPGDALLDFEGGGLINTIENGTLALNGPLAFIASGAATSSDSALAGPLTIEGSGGLQLQSGASVETGPMTDAGSINVDTGFLAVGGSSLTVNGLLNVTGLLTLGRSAMADAGPTVTVTGGLDNSGTINVTGDVPHNLSGALDVGGAAGFGAAGDLSGSVNLTGLSLLDFTGGGLITSIDTTGQLLIDGPYALLASGNATSSNSALTNLALIDGFFTLQDGAALTTTTSLSVGNGTNDSGLNVDNSGAGGSTMNVSGTLTLNNFAGLSIGNGGITAAALMTAATLDLAGATTPPTITLTGGAAQATLSVGSVAGFGEAGVLAGGNVILVGNALLDFTGGGQITSTAFGTSLQLDGANAFIASGNATSSNSALLGLATMAGNLTLLNNASMTTSGSLTVGNGTNGANVSIQTGGGLTVDGALSLVGTLDSFSVTSAAVSAAALANSAGIDIGAGGVLDVSGMLANAGNLNIRAGATASAGGLANTGTVTIGSGSTLSVGAQVYNQESGSTFDAGTIDAETIVITGGTLELAAGGVVNAGFSFAGIPGGELKIDGALMPTANIDAMAPGDTIDLANVAFSSGGAVNLLANNVLQVTENGGTFSLNLDPNQNFGDDEFHLASDGGEGTLISETAGAPMPPTFAAPQFVLADFGASPSAGGWGNQATYPVAVGDINGDGMADIVGFGASGVYVSLATGGGNFVQPILGINAFGANAGWGNQGAYPLELGDVTGNGRADIVGFGSAGVYVSLANGDGTFAQPILGIDAFGAAGGWGNQDAYPLELGDVTGNGRDDIIGLGSAGVYVSLANGDGTFAQPIFALDAFGADGGWGNQSAYPIEMGDVTGNGRDDIVGFGSAGVYVSLANGDGTFSQPILALNAFGADAGWGNQNLYPIELADVLSNGRDDIVAFGAAGVYVALANGDGTFAQPTLVTGSFGAAGGWSSQNEFPRLLGDVNGDKRADIVGFGTAGVYVALLDPQAGLVIN